MSDTLRERIGRVFEDHQTVVLNHRADCRCGWEVYELSKREDVLKAADNHVADAVLTVLRNPTDEDVERAAKANCEAVPEASPWADLDEFYRRELRVDTRATIHAYLGGDEA